VPNFVTVDHYDEGDLIVVVKRLNRRSQVLAGGGVKAGG
jgi:hypothetical protein